MRTREKIEEKALELFNQRGIEYVGMREIAAVLGMRIGNITYYFPTKDDLVYHIRNKLREANNAVMKSTSVESLSSFLGILNKSFHNQARFRCYPLSFVHIIYQNQRIKEEYQEIKEVRNTFLLQSFERLIDAGYLRPLSPHDLEFLQATIGLIARFWLSESQVVHQDKNPEQQIQLHLQMIARLLMPFVTEVGKKDVEAWLGK